jgi:hypothetical protein
MMEWSRFGPVALTNRSWSARPKHLRIRNTGKCVPFFLRFFYKKPELLKEQANVYDLKMPEKKTDAEEEPRHLPMRLGRCYSAPKSAWHLLYDFVLPISILDPWHFSTYGSGSSDPYLWLTDPYPDSDLAPDPAFFVSDLQDANKKYFFPKFYAYSFLKMHLHHSSEIKSHKEVTEQ